MGRRALVLLLGRLIDAHQPLLTRLSPLDNHPCTEYSSSLIYSDCHPRRAPDDLCPQLFVAVLALSKGQGVAPLQHPAHLEIPQTPGQLGWQAVF